MLGKLQPITVSTLTLVFSALLLIAARHAQAQTETVLYNFTGGSDGHGPISNGNLVFDSKGNLYGTTTVGGSCPSCGTVFELIPSNRSWEKNRSWKNMVLYSFTGFVDGDVPGSGLVFDSAGNLYGTTEGGGVFGQGTVFELSPNPGGAWTETVLYSFKGLGFNDGATPFTPVILDQARNIYGTTSYGGTDGFNGGTVFELTQSGGVWSESILHGFSRSGNDGLTPNALVMDKAGNLYGTTVQGGAYGLGTAFEMSESNGIWTESVIYSFHGLDGDAPYAGVTFDQTGNLYGTTAAGGRGTRCPAGCGTVFELSPSRKGWAEKVLHNFKGGKDGSYPYAGVTLDAQGNLYGTTSFDGGGPCQLQGVLGCGTVFILKKSGKTWTKQVFRFNGDNGAYPQAGIVLDKEGNLYGTTIFGGSGLCSENEPGCGLVFEVNPSAAVTTTTLSSAPNPSTYGQAVTFTAVVTSSAGTPPDGETVSFEHGKTVLGTGALSSGSASFTSSTLKVASASAQQLAPDAPLTTPSARFAYLFENSDIVGYTVNPTTSQLRAIQRVPLKNTATDFSATIHPNNKFLYVPSGASIGSPIYGYSIAATGLLNALKGSPFASTTGASGLPITANGMFGFGAGSFFGSTQVEAFSINITTGALTSLATYPSGNTPLGQALTPNNSFLYVADCSAAGKIYGFGVNATNGTHRLETHPFSEQKQFRFVSRWSPRGMRWLKEDVESRKDFCYDKAFQSPYGNMITNPPIKKKK